MNLVYSPWIPVIDFEGRSHTVGLADVFAQAERWADLNVNPCERVALTRLLICIVQAAIDGPEDLAGWASCKPGIAAAANAYLASWQKRFNLFGDGAFLQLDALEPNNNALADKIDLTRACGNSPTLFDHEATPDGRVPEPAALARALLVYQNFSPGGRIGTAMLENRETEASCTMAPALEGSMLHTIVLRPDLLGTIHANLMTREDVRELPNSGWGRPCWEFEPMTPSALAANTNTWLGRLVPCPRAIRCAADSPKITLAEGLRYNKIPEVREPMATVVEVGSGDKARLAYLGVNLARHPWRELNSILAFKSANDRGGAYALARLHLHVPEQETDMDATFDLWTGGLAADQAKLLDMAQWNFTLNTSLLESVCLNRYRLGVVDADNASGALRNAVRDYGAYFKSQKTNPWQGNAQRLFWSQLDQQADILADWAADEQSPRADRWIESILFAMQSAYAQACPHETPRQIQAYAQGLRTLNRWRAASDGGKGKNPSQPSPTVAES